LLLFLLTNYVTTFARQPIRYRSGRSVPAVSLKADHTTAQRPHSLDDHTARLHAPRICLITTAHG